MHVRVGNEVRIGYFFLSFKKPFYISRKVEFLMEEPKRKKLVFIKKDRNPSFTPESDKDAWTL
jgi:hypothetical protein